MRTFAVMSAVMLLLPVALSFDQQDALGGPAEGPERHSRICTRILNKFCDRIDPFLDGIGQAILNAANATTEGIAGNPAALTVSFLNALCDNSNGNRRMEMPAADNMEKEERWWWNPPMDVLKLVCNRIAPFNTTITATVPGNYTVQDVVSSVYTNACPNTRADQVAMGPERRWGVCTRKLNTFCDRIDPFLDGIGQAILNAANATTEGIAGNPAALTVSFLNALCDNSNGNRRMEMPAADNMEKEERWWWNPPMDVLKLVCNRIAAFNTTITATVPGNYTVQDVFSSVYTNACPNTRADQVAMDLN